MKFSNKWAIQLPMFEGEGGGGTGTGTGTTGTPDAGGAGATGAGTVGASGTQAGQAGTSGTTGTGPTQPGSQPPANWNQADWIPRHRFNEVSQRAQRAEQIHQQNQLLTRQVQALTGAQPANPADRQADEVRNAFKQMFPKLGSLTDQHIDRLLALSEQSDQITETTKNYWQNVGQQMVGKSYEGVAEALGIDELTPSQQRRIAQAYTAMLVDDFNRARAEGRQSDIVRRHEAQDPKLVSEFVKQFTDDFIEPVRRRQIQNNVQRVSQRVPGGRATSHTPITSKPKIDYTNEQAVEDAAVAAFAAHGGAFGKR